MNQKLIYEGLSHPLMQTFLDLNLPLSQCLLFGSGPMFFHGLKGIDNDLDFVLTGEAWRRACIHFVPTNARSGVGEYIKVNSEAGVLEFFTCWQAPFTNHELFKRAYVLPNGLPIASLFDILTYKKAMNREKDMGDIKALEMYLGLAKAGR